MKIVKITLNNEKQIFGELKIELSYDDLCKKVTNSAGTALPLIFETKDGAIILPYLIWSNCVITLS